MNLDQVTRIARQWADGRMREVFYAHAPRLKQLRLEKYVPPPPEDLVLPLPTWPAWRRNYEPVLFGTEEVMASDGARGELLILGRLDHAATLIGDDIQNVLEATAEPGDTIVHLGDLPHLVSDDGLPVRHHYSMDALEIRVRAYWRRQAASR